ncbi:unnamed protein product [Urochloa humidicola]
MRLIDDAGGWCNFPPEHLEVPEAFLCIAKAKDNILPVQLRSELFCSRFVSDEEKHSTCCFFQGGGERTHVS